VREFDVLGTVVGNWSTPPWTTADDDGDVDGEVDGDDPAFVSASSGNADDPRPIPVDPEWVDLISFCLAINFLNTCPKLLGGLLSGVSIAISAIFMMLS
jgi:hypothetical protein